MEAKSKAMEFQYNACYGSTPIVDVVTDGVNNFNTTLVTVQRML